MTMTVAELIEILQDLPEDAEVRMAQQPNWPFEYSIREAVYVSAREASEAESETEEAALDYDEDDAGVVYLGEGSQIGYLPGGVARSLGWR